MQTLYHTAVAASPRPSAARRVAAAALIGAARALAALGARLGAAPPVVHGAIEYHADAGAPEGALYVDGVLVAHLSGVDRL